MKKTPQTKQSHGVLKEQLTLIPEPSLSPMLPKPNSKESKALQHLLTNPLTQVIWLEMGEGWRLAATICNLANMGWQISSLRVKTATSHVALYQLTSEGHKAANIIRKVMK